ncbi:MAG TPA: patatin-like phospholipase family protein [Acidimicrobiales bacterium]
MLGAGGTVGHAFHAGTLAALAEAGWDARDATVIVGTSTGAVTGALLRAGMSPADMAARVTGGTVSATGRRLLDEGGGWPTFTADMAHGSGRPLRPSSPRLLAELARRPWRARPGIILAALTAAGSVSTRPIADGFNHLFGECWPDRPLWVCAVDLDRGERVVFGHPDAPETDVGTAVAASSAVPTFFEPVVVAGRRFIDGGAHSPVNGDVIADALGELDAVVVSAPMGIGGPPGRVGVDLPGRLLNHFFAVHELRRVARSGVLVLGFEPHASELELMHYNAFDPTHRSEIVRRAFAAARERAGALLAPARVPG